MKASTNPYKVEIVTDYGMTYYQVVRKRDEAILFANKHTDNIARFILDESIDETGFDTVPEFVNNHIF